MVGARLLKGKTKVLISTKSKEARTVDPERQISVDEYREIKRRCDRQKSRYEQGEMSKDGAIRPRVTSRILVSKWQRQKEKDYQRWLEEQEYSVSRRNRGMNESKLNHIGIVLSLDIAGTKG